MNPKARQSEHMSKLLIWDIDGTLMHCKGVGRASLNRTFQELFGVADAFTHINFGGGMDSVIVRDAMSQHGINANEADRLHQFFDQYAIYLEEKLKQLGDQVLLPGVQTLFAQIGFDPRFCHAIGTGNIQVGARLKLQNTGLSKYFKCGGYADGLEERWQIVDQAYKNATALWGAAFDDVYVIGDTTRDVESAQKLGFQCICVANGFHTKEALVAAGANIILPDLTEPAQFLTALD